MAKTRRNAGPISLGRCFTKPGADQIHDLERKLNGKIKLIIRTFATHRPTKGPTLIFIKGSWNPRNVAKRALAGKKLGVARLCLILVNINEY
jgi:hypothetical protein